MYSRKFSNSEPVSIPSDYSGVAYSPQGLTGQNNINNTGQRDSEPEARENFNTLPRVPFDELQTSMRAPATRHSYSGDYGMPQRTPHEQNNYDTPAMARASGDDRYRSYPRIERASPRYDDDYPSCRTGECGAPRKDVGYDGKLSDERKESKGKKGSGLLGSLSSLTKHSFSMEDLILIGLILLLLSDDNADMDILLILGFLLLIGL